MSRPLRIEFPGAVYHITSRGNAKADIFLDDGDRLLFLKTLTRVVKRFNWLCHAYCLMDNHYHLLIETPEGNLSAGMRQLNGVYTQAFNRKHGRVGHVFQGRFKAILVEKQSHLLELCRYVVLNPVRAGAVGHPADHPWNSFLATLGKEPCPPFLSTDWILSNFSQSRDKAKSTYRQFIEGGLAQSRSPWTQLHSQIVLGGDAFVQKVKNLLEDRKLAAEIPRHQRQLGRPALEDLFPRDKLLSKQERNRLIREAHLAHGYRLTEIARAFGLHYTTISKIVNAENR
ncbi:REP element-mobilizing transposase RayT [Geothermobacter ehrlichii]|uniref:REP element-mobilizing transposase RayT n=1 Tax=Geothermobacter ehrlichii TaxID=213224 RepID=A0A5D3WKK5_9BACT|nr:transposase [Geothermobacter ehrlichii]TYO96833.1 REP element-mobilizing transposase RayT [Geothermobacter ehrlichii]